MPPQTAKTAPEAVEREVRRMEDEAKKRVNDLRRVLDRNPEECRALLNLVLDGPVTFKPIELPEGPRYEVHARASLKKILAAATGTARFTNQASPEGVENRLAAS